MPLSIPHTFTADTPARASEVNTNFNAVAAELNNFPTLGALKIGGVLETNLANNAVTNDKLANDAVGQNKIASGALDGVTLELSGGKVQVKDEGITATKLGPGAVDLVTPRYLCQVIDYNTKLGSIDAFEAYPVMAEWSIPSFGTLAVHSDFLPLGANTALFTMKVRATEETTIPMKLFGSNQFCKIFVNELLQYEQTTAINTSNAPVTVPVTLTAGMNMVQIMLRDNDGSAYLRLLGDLINGSTTFFAGVS